MPITYPAGARPLTADAAPMTGGGVAPDGRVLSANRWHLTMDGEPFPIVAGELLFQRYPEDEWDDAVRALRDGGITLVTSYVFWSLVEPKPGEFDFAGPNDLRRFAEICAGYGLMFSPRIGPFNNSEFLLGGLPPWLFGTGATERSDDPRYLEFVRRYFRAISEQLRGTYFSDGGHIPFVQLENELSHAPNDWGHLFGHTASEHRGPTGAAFTAHMSSLRRIAIEEGIAPAYFTMTGWGTAGEVPDGEFLPTYGAYMDLHPRPERNGLHTTFRPNELPYRGRYPVAFCELGTGSPHRAAYASRTPVGSVVTPAFTRMASSESIFLGYYVFHGGTNPVRGDGFGWTTKEPHFTQRSYDFWAPVSEFGERRASFYGLVPLNRLFRGFGCELAGLGVVEPVDPVVDPNEDRLRAILRSDGEHGFVFLSNYGNSFPMSDRTGVVVDVPHGDSTVRLPRRIRLDVASGASIALPVALDAGAGVTVLSATAQPLCRLGSDAEPAIVFAAQQDDVEYVFAAARGVDAPTDAAVHEDSDGICVVVRAGSSEPVVVHGPDGAMRVFTVTWQQAEHSQLAGEGSSARLVTSADDFTVDGDTVTVSRLRPLDETEAAAASVRVISAGGAWELPLELPGASIPATGVEVEEISPSRAILRTEAEPAADLWLDLDYTGELCRVFDTRTGILVADDFHSGTWRIRAGRFGEALTSKGLQFRVEPLATREEVDNAEGILLDSALRVESEARIDAIRSLQLVRGSASIASASDRTA